MSKVKSYKVRYYQVQPVMDESGSLTPKDISERLVSIIEKENYSSVDYYGQKLVLYKEYIKRIGNLYFGTIVSTQMTEIPPRMDVETSEIRPLARAMKDGEGLAIETCFMIDPSMNIVAVEARKGAARANAVVFWIANNIGVGRLQSAVVVSPDSLAKFYSIDKVLKFRLKIAKVTNRGFLSGIQDNLSFRELMNIADASSSDVIDVSLSSDTKTHRGIYRPSLNLLKVKEFVKSALGYEGEGQVVDLEVDGFDSLGNRTFVDLIFDEISSTIRVEQEEEGRFVRNFYSSEHYKEINRVYSQIRTQLLSTYEIRE